MLSNTSRFQKLTNGVKILYKLIVQFHNDVIDLYPCGQSRATSFNPGDLDAALALQKLPLVVPAKPHKNTRFIFDGGGVSRLSIRCSSRFGNLLSLQPMFDGGGVSRFGNLLFHSVDGGGVLGNLLLSIQLSSLCSSRYGDTLNRQSLRRM